MAEVSPMALKGPLLSLPLLFSVLFLVSLVDNNPGNYRKFLKQHVDHSRIEINPHNYCKQIMRARGLTRPTCMGKNIFIHARRQRIKIMCGEGGMPFRNSTSSDTLSSYIITTCQFTSVSPPDLCNYSGRSERRRIRVACSRGVPIGFISILYGHLP